MFQQKNLNSVSRLPYTGLHATATNIHQFSHFLQHNLNKCDIQSLDAVLNIKSKLNKKCLERAYYSSTLIPLRMMVAVWKVW
jgi:hypothetical protein